MYQRVVESHFEMMVPEVDGILLMFLSGLDSREI
jgi:hypothetical protein